MDETNIAPQSTPPVVEPTPTTNPTPPKKSINKWMALGIFVVVLGSAAAGAYYLKQKAPPITNPIPPAPSPLPEPLPLPTPEPYVPPDLFEGKNRSYNYSEPKISGLVTWHYPSRTNSLDVFIAMSDGTADYIEENAKYTYFYELGTINSGKYKDYKIYLGTFTCNCMGGPAFMRILAKTGAKSVFLTKYSDPMDNIQTDILDKNKYLVDSTFNISDLEYPDGLMNGTSEKLIHLTNAGFFQSSAYIPFEVTELTPIFTVAGLGQVFTSDSDSEETPSIFNNNGFYVKAPDWSTKFYEYRPDFVNEESGIANVTWADGSKNTAAYVYKDTGGCGATNYISVISPSTLSIQNDLSLAGLTSKGKVIYELKNKNHQILKSLYNDEYFAPYDPSTGQPGKKITYDQFISKHPLFFWVDPFDRLIKFKNSIFQPLAECGKPVIYLYPTQTQNVSVKVNPTGGFSYTEPDYGMGWNVLAKPNGELTNSADGKIYPYLFWEGRSKDVYQIPDKGFVVAQNDVHNFLNEKLAKLGLNAKETADFEEYWEPYFQGSPYYFVTFMGNSVMNQVAPLQITPKPDTIIRILMDFAPLQKPISVQTFEIKTPIRSGFTVVEWGGVKH